MDTDKFMVEKINEAVEDQKLELTPWETDFMESITEYVESGKSTSRKQREALDKIQEKIPFW